MSLHRSRRLRIVAALVLVPGSVLAFGQSPAVAAPAATPDVVPDGATATTSAGLLGLTVADVGLPEPLPRIRAARVDVAPTTGSFGAATPRARASASNLGADAAGIDLSGLLSQAQQTAPPDHPDPATGPQVARISAPPIIAGGVSSSTAHARLAADGSCPAPGTPLTTSTTSTADVSVLDLGTVGSLLEAPGTVSATQSVRLTQAPGVGDARAVTSTATTDVAALELFDTVTVGISEAPVLTATASGRPGGADVTYTQPVVTVTAPGAPGSPFVLDAANETARFTLPANPLLQVELSLGALSRAVAADGTSATGSAALLHLTLNLLPLQGNGVNVATVDVAPLSAAAGAPAGGITCAADPVVDTDGDGLSDDQEAGLGTDPNDADSDDDGLRDGPEVNTYDTDPLDADTDDGGVNDGDEVQNGTDPSDGSDDQPGPAADSDGDGLTDEQEADLGTDPSDADTDGDGLTDGQEVNTEKTDPLDPDSDDGGVDDGDEVDHGTDPLDGSDDVTAPLDTDGDGLSDEQEATLGTDPGKGDSDGDGLSDGAEVNTYDTDPLKADTDGGGVTDGVEVGRGTDPNKAVDDDPPAAPGAPTADPDGDGLTTAQEAQQGTDPNKADTDGDGLTDGQELSVHGTDPNVADTDKDGLNDGPEVVGFRIRERFKVCGRKARSWIKVATDPTRKDTDRDGLSDRAEVVGYKIKQRVVLRGGKVIVIGLTRTNPTKKDTDRDGLSDKVEKTGKANKRFGKHRTDPSKCDTDRGGVSDGREVTYRSDPSNYASGPRSRDERRMLLPREDRGDVG
ncbi:hypothetical protein J2X46_003545 [Nocardioides sp. BE266]|uniref:binary toxin-like calcium binding domain-containing protein n=1 Tax=Nocardioides sp. BE266 TaxID=2817725 RepID=UPI002864C559|nr:binary toxin-like calcium binding domain-containing protein [Nocardioides sp. BE266]MDR7254552.1 hypothetical protein [Nocardioides sp. BE266]